MNGGCARNARLNSFAITANMITDRLAIARNGLMRYDAPITGRAFRQVIRLHAYADMVC